MLRKRMIPFLLSICLLVGTFAVPASAEDLENGSQNQTTTVDEKTTAWGSDYATANKFEITSVADLQAFANMVNDGKDFSGKTVTLTCSLDLTGVTWVPIGTDDSGALSELDLSFSGKFDGSNHTISNLTVQYGETDDGPYYICGGLFGKVTGEICNLKLENLSITAAGDYLGGIAGYLAKGGQISGCSVSGTISGAEYDSTAYGSYAGGIAGYSEGAIENCTSSCTIKDALNQVGGIAGEIDGGTIINCNNAGIVTGLTDVGGIVGDSKNGTISGCVNSGTVTSEKATADTNMDSVGGIAGYALKTTIENSQNTGSITATGLESIGGIVGYFRMSTATGCTNSGNVEGGNGTGGIVGYAQAYSSDGYEITDCSNTGTITGKIGVGGIAGVSSANATNSYNTEQTISNCVNSAPVSGESDVGGISGTHNYYVYTGSANSVATVSGCINTGYVSAKDTDGNVGAIVGSNTNAVGSSGGEASNPGKVENNFWPAELCVNAVGSGAGSSESETSEVVKNNSSYNLDGTLTTPITTGEGESQKNITTISEAVNELLGGGEDDKIPEVLKVTVTFDRNGHGTAPVAQEVVIGTKINLPSMDNDGYWTFLNWTANATTYDTGAEYTVTADTTFVAQWRDDTPSTPVIPSDPSDNSDPTYSISLPSKVTGGEVSIQKRYAEKGETVTIIVTPDDGYELDELIVTDSKGNELDLTDKGNGKFTFKMPAGRVEIEVSFQEIVIEPVNPFVDVSTSDYYYDAVLWAVENGVTNGTSATTFGPNMAVSRAQMVTFLWRAHGSPKATGTNPFTDVSTSDYYYDAVLWAVANGVTNGTSATTFSPDTAVTRSQAVTFQWRAAGSPVVSGSSFGDVATDAYYVNAVTWAVANGITNGTGGNTFSPDVVVSRAQAVTFLWRELA